MEKAKVPNIIYHYCSLPTFMKIIENSTLRMTNIVKSNDFSEITYCIDEFVDAFNQAFWKLKRLNNDEAFSDFSKSLDVDKIVQNSINNASLTYYVTCFSTACDLLSQWRGYADDGQGVSIGFCSQPFVACAKLINWKFDFIHYGMDQTKEDLVDYIVRKYCRPLKWESRKPRIYDYENITASIIDSMVYNAVFYKNPAFSEEQETRLVYYPFGSIRSLLVKHKSKDITTNQLYYDRMHDTLLSSNNAQGFVREPVSFFKRGNSIVSYIDLNFQQFKDFIISDIILGPKAQLNDLDLRLFLLSNGYDISKINISESKASYR